MAHLTRDRPKSLLEIGGKAIVEHSLDVLASRGVRHATFVIGYHGARLVERLGTSFGPIVIDYVENADFATTEHGWSMRLGLEHWARDPSPLLLLDADNLYEPEILDALLDTPAPDVVLVDAGFDTGTRDEELVLGRNGRITGLVRGVSGGLADYAGAFVGLNRFSASFAHRVLDHMRALPTKGARSMKYERILDAHLRENTDTLAYLDVGGRSWINVNHESELAAAGRIAEHMAAAV